MLHRTALLIIDMQEDYIGMNSKYGYDSEVLINKINERVLYAKQNNYIIIYVKNKKILRSGIYVSDLVQGLIVETEFIIEKDRSSVFSNLEFSSLLKSYEISNIEVVGIDGNCCVASTAIDAARLGYSVEILMEYIGIRNIKKFSKTKEKFIQENIKIIE